ncbi:MAG TPA: glycosyltransferase [Ignavibacteriaceae bacterium]|nr:glycosyltransferase [Ignavibacteriaceae bacterium]
MISVITITYNNSEELVRTINSLQKGSFIESVIINGGSCERTGEFLKSYNGVVINEKDRGIADAFNKGIKNSSGKHLMFLNSGDELIDKTYLKKAREFLDINPGFSFVHSNIVLIDESGEKLYVRPPMKNVGRGMPYLHPTMIVRREVFDKIGLFGTDLKIAMDYDFIVRLKKAGLRGFYFNEVFPVKMDGTGKSVKQESAALKECFMVLKQNEYLNFENFLGFTVRYMLFIMRKFMSAAGLNKLLLKLKKLKHKN